MGCSPWIPRNSSHRPQYDDTGASRHVESNTVEVLWVSAGFVATDFPSGPRPLPTHAQPACFPRPTKNSEEPRIRQQSVPRTGAGCVNIHLHTLLTSTNARLGAQYSESGMSRLIRAK